MMPRKELMNEVVDVILVSAAVVGLRLASKKLLGEMRNDASSLKDIAKLAVAVTGSKMLVQYAQSKSIQQAPLMQVFDTGNLTDISLANKLLEIAMSWSIELVNFNTASEEQYSLNSLLKTCQK